MTIKEAKGGDGEGRQRGRVGQASDQAPRSVGGKWLSPPCLRSPTPRSRPGASYRAPGVQPGERSRESRADAATRHTRDLLRRRGEGRTTSQSMEHWARHHPYAITSYLYQTGVKARDPKPKSEEDRRHSAAPTLPHCLHFRDAARCGRPARFVPTREALVRNPSTPISLYAHARSCAGFHSSSMPRTGANVSCGSRSTEVRSVRKGPFRYSADLPTVARSAAPSVRATQDGGIGRAVCLVGPKRLLSDPNCLRRTRCARMVPETMMSISPTGAMPATWRCTRQFRPGTTISTNLNRLAARLSVPRTH